MCLPREGLFGYISSIRELYFSPSRNILTGFYAWLYSSFYSYNVAPNYGRTGIDATIFRSNPRPMVNDLRPWKTFQMSVSIKLIVIMVCMLLSIRCNIVALIGMCRGREIRHPQQRIHNSGSCCLLDGWSGWKRCWWLQILEVLNCRMWQSCRCQLLLLILLLLLLERLLIVPAPFFFQLCVQKSYAPASLLANLI